MNNNYKQINKQQKEYPIVKTMVVSQTKYPPQHMQLETQQKKQEKKKKKRTKEQKQVHHK